MKHPNSLSLRRRVALELWRKRMDIAVKEHPLRQLFGSARSVAICIAVIAAATAE